MGEINMQLNLISIDKSLLGCETEMDQISYPKVPQLNLKQLNLSGKQIISDQSQAVLAAISNRKGQFKVD